MEAADLDAMSSATVDGIGIEHVQLEARPFTGRWSVVRCRRMTAQLGREDLAVARRTRISPQRWAFIVPLTVSSAARWDGRPLRGREFIACSPGSESYAFDPAGARFAVLTVPLALAAAMSALAGITLDSTTASGLLLTSPGRMSELRSQLVELEAMVHTTPRLLTLDALRRMERLILGRLVACLQSPESDVDGSSADGQREIVKRAEAYFRGHLGEPLPMARLSTAAGVSERTLRNAFQTVYATSPKRYLRLWQLQQVRRALRVADPARSTVTDVATLHGFFELGRFAGEYKAFFGEAPSETLYSL